MMGCRHLYRAPLCKAVPRNSQQPGEKHAAPLIENSFEHRILRFAPCEFDPQLKKQTAAKLMNC